MQLQNDTLLQGGKYRIEKVLGQGGFGITYLATQTMLERKVCIKEFFFKEYCDRNSSGYITSTTNGNKEIVNRFLNKFLKEAKTIARLDHSNIIRILDIFEENCTAYYVMDYVEGESLNDMVNRRGALPENEAVSYINRVADALQYIHQKNINHLDVKPSNIMIRQDDYRVILIDFGLAKQYDTQGSQTSTTPVGISHGYAPMEQYKQGGVSTFSPQADIYALGATLYKLVTGKTPPQAMDVFSDGLPTLPSSISIPVSNAIKKAMQPRKTDRPQSIAEFLDILGENKSYSKPSVSSSTAYSSVGENTIIAEPVNAKNIINGHEYVDLGLPSGLKWATCNVGANTPHEYGDYFAWGETETKEKYTEENCKTIEVDYIEEKTFFRTKTERKIIGKKENFKDTAHANWGGSWRMPTKREMEELKNKCTWTWTTQSGIKGYKVTGLNNNSIFIPAAGCCMSTSYYYVGEHCLYWSSTPLEYDDNCAYDLHFSSNSHGVYWIGRDHGHTVRPVSE